VKKYTVYECEVCRSRHRKPVEAQKCEESHTEMETVQIVECHFDSTGNLAIPASLRKKVPGAVTVRFGTEATEVATYHLIKVGP